MHDPLVPQQSSQEAAEAISLVLNTPLPQNHAQFIYTIQGCERSFNSQFGLSVHVQNKNAKYLCLTLLIFILHIIRRCKIYIV